MFRKILLIFITVFLLSNNSLKALLALLILSLSLFFQHKLNPFNSEDLNKMEFRSSIVSLFTLYFGFFNYLVKAQATRIILFLIVALVNAYFLAYWGFKMLLINISKLHLCFKSIIKKYFPSYTKTYKKFFSASNKYFNFFNSPLRNQANVVQKQLCIEQQIKNTYIR